MNQHRQILILHCFLSALYCPARTRGKYNCTVLRIISLNLNGIRAAYRKGLAAWLAAQNADILCVQELKAQEKDISDDMRRCAGLHGYFSCAARAGYSGVGIYSRRQPQRITRRFGSSEMDSEGRFIRLDFDRCSIISLYLPSGSSGDARQQVKYTIMAQTARRLAAWQRESARSGRQFIICGDWNIAHTRKDICNWRGNQKNSGFLPEERQWLDTLLSHDSGGLGFADVFRHLNRNDGEYTWWSNRGNAWANNVGWRIDYQLATAAAAAKATRTDIERGERFSDHAPLTIDYRMRL